MIYFTLFAYTGINFLEKGFIYLFIYFVTLDNQTHAFLLTQPCPLPAEVQQHGEKICSKCYLRFSILYDYFLLLCPGLCNFSSRASSWCCTYSADLQRNDAMEWKGIWLRALQILVGECCLCCWKCEVFFTLHDKISEKLPSFDSGSSEAALSSFYKRWEAISR